MQVTYSSPPPSVLPLRRGGDAPGVDLMASLTDVQLLNIKTLLTSDATQGVIRVTLRNASQAKPLGETFITWVPVHYSEYIPDLNKTDRNIKLRCFFQASPYQYRSFLWSTKSQRYQRGGVGNKPIVVPTWVTFNLRDALVARPPSNFRTFDS